MKITKSQLEQLIKEAVKAQGGNIKTQQKIVESVKRRLNEDDYENYINSHQEKMDQLRNVRKEFENEFKVFTNSLNVINGDISSLRYQVSMDDMPDCINYLQPKIDRFIKNFENLKTIASSIANYD